MKKNNLLSILVAGTLILCGCSKDFLDRSPETSISDGEYWKTTNDLRIYCNSFYNLLPNGTGTIPIGIYGEDADNGSDNMIKLNYDTRLNGEFTSATSGGWSRGDWSRLRNINYLLSKYGQVNDTWDNVKVYVGEALFFRAFFYFDMLRKFGDLPWINKPLDITSTELFTARMSRGIIVDSMLANLDSAIAYLPTKSKAAASRVYKEFAMAFASRVALYEGTWEKYHAGTLFGVTGSNGQKYLEKCASLAEAVINLGVFALQNTGVANGYWSLFNQTDPSSGKEVIFWRQFTTSIPDLAHYWSYYSWSGAGRGLTKNLVDDYLCKDGLPIASSPLYKGDATLSAVVTDRDPRLVQTMCVNDGFHVLIRNQPGQADVYFKAPSFGGANESKSATGYQLFKGHNPEYSQSFPNKGTTAYIILRYAEVLLNFAEAKAELGTLTQADVDKSIKLLRTRVGMPNLVLASIATDPNWLFPALSPAINEVRRERRVELACEGLRHDDIFRWAAAGTLINGWKPKGAKKQQWVGDANVDQSALNSIPTDANGYIELYKNSSALVNGYKFNVQRDYLWPIPLSEMQIPGNVLTQNPGW